MIAISRVEEFTARLLALKKDILTLQSSAWRGHVCFQDNEIPLFLLLPQNIAMLTKNLRLVLMFLSQFKMTEGNWFSFLYLESSLRQAHGIKRECRLRLWTQILNRSRVYFRQEIQSNIYCEQQAGCDSPLQIWAYFYLYKYLSSLMIMVDQERK